MTETNERMEEIEVPQSLNERQVRLCKQFVIDKHDKGIGVAEFCNRNNVSTATWYKWQDNPTLDRYLNDLQGNIISDSEKESYAKVKKKIMEMATAKNASVKEIDLYLSTFSYLKEADNRETMKRLGISDKNDSVDTRTVDEKKASLLSRLKG